MREIKFRLWDYDNNLFDYIYINDLEYTADVLTSFNSYFNKDYFKNSPTYIQQFTGLKDKNGVEIYEGDKVSDGVFIYVVKYNQHNTKYCIEPIQKVDGELSISDYMFYNQLGNGYHDRKDLEVIGNIHENV